MARLAHRLRRGSQALLFGVTLIFFLGFAALAVDISWQLHVRAQAQDIADTAAISAMIAYRRTADLDISEAAAIRTVRHNELGGEMPSVQLTWGRWSEVDATPTFIPDDVQPHAVHARISRQGDRQVPYFLAPIFGQMGFDVQATAVGAARSAEVALVLDITGSWGEADFAEAREAVTGALTLLENSTSDLDRINMVIFTNRYAWVYSEWSAVADPIVAQALRNDWNQLNIASKAGVDANPLDGVACVLNAARPGSHGPNDFNDPVGGCYPPMPREYTDEPGTDHSTGILLAKQLFEEVPSGTNVSYRAMIVITDGRPNDLGAASGTIRASQGYTESRWREYLGPVPRSKDDIRAASIQATEDLWNDRAVHTWVVSLVADDPMMPAMVRGDGFYVRTDDPTQLAGILGDIVANLPLAVVE